MEDAVRYGKVVFELRDLEISATRESSDSTESKLREQYIKRLRLMDSDILVSDKIIIMINLQLTFLGLCRLL